MNPKGRFAIAASVAVLFGAGLIVTGCSSDDSGSDSAGQDATTAVESNEAAPQQSSNANSGGEQAGGQQAGGAAQTASQPGQYVDYSPELVA
jgi:hypothetical protein